MKKKLHPASPLHGGSGSSVPAASGAVGPVGGTLVAKPAPPGAHDRSRADAGAARSANAAWLIVLLVVLAWSYWPTLLALWRFWDSDPDYSGGKVVPLIVAYLVWSNRKELERVPARTSWWGAVVLVLAQAVRFGGVLYAYSSLEHVSLLLSVAGLVLLMFGPTFTYQVKWILLFLALMFPLPRRIHNELALPMQDFATTSAQFGLELLGVPVAREGNVLRLGQEASIAVAEACSGLRMLTAFVVVAATLAFVVRRPSWQKAVLVASSVVVAIFCNTLRLIVTALVYRMTNSLSVEQFFHDFAGVTMMPVAVAASIGLLALMKWISADAGKKETN